MAPADRVPAELHAAILRGLAADPDQRWPDLEALLAAMREAIAMAQPGMFAGSPLPVVRMVGPLMLLLPVIWASLELAGVVAVSARSWLFVSGAQLVLVASVLFPFRERVLAQMSDRRLIAMPLVIVPLLLGHRILVLSTGGSVEQMFAYDFLTVAAVALAVVLLVERGMWPMIALGLSLAILAAARPAWTPHLWLAFTLSGPVVVGTVGARAAKQRSRGIFYGPTDALRSSKKTREKI